MPILAGCLKISESQIIGTKIQSPTLPPCFWIPKLSFRLGQNKESFFARRIQSVQIVIQSIHCFGRNPL